MLPTRLITPALFCNPTLVEEIRADLNIRTQKAGLLSLHKGRDFLSENKGVEIIGVGLKPRFEA